MDDDSGLLLVGTFAHVLLSNSLSIALQTRAGDYYFFGIGAGEIEGKTP
jgi:hypothetical protein